MTARRQKLEAHRNPMKVTNYILACQNEGFSRMEFNRTWLDGAQTHLGAGKISHDGDPAADGAAGGPDARDDLAVLSEVAVRKI